MSTKIDLCSLAFDVKNYPTAKVSLSRSQIQLITADYSGVLCKPDDINTIPLTCSITWICPDLIFTLITWAIVVSNQSSTSMNS